MMFLRIWVIVFCFAGVYNKNAFGQSWEPIRRAPFHGNVDFVAIHPAHPDFLFIGSNGSLYGSFNGAEDWKRLIGLGRFSKMHQLYFGHGRMFLLTSEGLFESGDEGRHWQRVFQGTGRERNVLSIARDPRNQTILYLGTAGGLFQSGDGGRTWAKVTNELGHQEIRAIETDPVNGEIFIAGEKGLYRSMPAKSRLDRVYVLTSSAQPNPEEPTDSDDEGSSSSGKMIHMILVTSIPDQTVAIGTTEGLFMSEDEGNSWERLPTSGLRSTNVLDLAYARNQKLWVAATDKGVFTYDERGKHWQEFESGLPLLRVNRLALGNGEPQRLYAATDEGVYVIKIETGFYDLELAPPLSLGKLNLLNQLFALEPSIRLVQKQAIHYANVSNWKIRRWQWASRFRSLIPSLSVGKSFSISEHADIDRGGTNDPDRFIVGPSDRSKDWEFDVNWDLADLLWNSSQTSIDSREKLMVELRDDILSETTRLYFERRRAQVEFVFKPPLDPFEQLQDLLRIDELTANIDAFTDGYFSKELKTIYTEHPEFLRLWENDGDGSRQPVVGSKVMKGPSPTEG